MAERWWRDWEDEKMVWIDWSDHDQTMTRRFDSTGCRFWPIDSAAIRMRAISKIISLSLNLKSTNFFFIKHNSIYRYNLFLTVSFKTKQFDLQNRRDAYPLDSIQFIECDGSLVGYSTGKMAFKIRIWICRSMSVDWYQTFWLQKM